MNRTLGLIFMVVGVVGCVISVLCVPAIWIGRAALDEQVSQVAQQVRDPLQQANDAATNMVSRLQNLSGAVNSLSGETLSTGDGGNFEQQAASRLLAVLDERVTPQYDQARAAYLNVRDRLRAASDLADALRRLAPGVGLPTLPSDALANLDAQFQALDDNLRQMRSDLAAGRLPDVLPGADAVRRIDAALGNLGTGVNGLVSSAQALQARIQGMLAQVDQAQATVSNALTGVSIVLTLVSVYVGLLHVALFAFGRRLRRTIAVVEPEPVAEAVAV